MPVTKMSVRNFPQQNILKQLKINITNLVRVVTTYVVCYGDPSFPHLISPVDINNAETRTQNFNFIFSTVKKMPRNFLVSWCSAGYRLYLKVSVSDKFLYVLLKKHTTQTSCFSFKLRSIQCIIFVRGAQ